MSLPIPELDDKTFAELFEEARKLIPRYAPEWTDHNLSDPGITMIDLFAWVAEMQVYGLNRITDKNILKFLSLVGLRPQPPLPARVQVTFSQVPPARLERRIPRWTQIAAEDNLTGEQIVFETDEKLWITHLEKIEHLVSETNSLRVDNTASNREEGVFYFAFGENPRAGDKLYLGFPAALPLPKNEFKLMIYLYETDLPPAGAAPEGEEPDTVPPAQLDWQYWNGTDWKTLAVKDRTSMFTRSGQVAFTWPADAQARKLSGSNELFYYIRVVVQRPGYEIPPRIDTIRLNTISATQGEFVRSEKFLSTGLPWQEITLQHKPVLANTLTLKIYEPDGNWHIWEEVKDFDASGAESRHYTLDHANGIIRFGDGITGRIPPVSQDSTPGIWVVRYRTGGGERGNLPPGKINRILKLGSEELGAGSNAGIGVTIPSAKFKNLAVLNRRAASGGEDTESLQETKKRARQDLKMRTRGVTSEDFERLALATPGLRVARAKALANYHPDFPGLKIPGAVTVVVVPVILNEAATVLPKPSEGFLQTVKSYLENKRLIATNLRVVGPTFVKIHLKATVQINPKLGPEKIRREAVNALREFLNPIGGGPEKKGWEFGRWVFKSEIFQVLQTVPGVTCVEWVDIKAEGCYKQREENIAIPRTGLVFAVNIEISLKQ